MYVRTHMYVRMYVKTNRHMISNVRTHVLTCMCSYHYVRLRIHILTHVRLYHCKCTYACTCTAKGVYVRSHVRKYNRTYLYTVECPIICIFFMLCVVLETFCQTSQLHRSHSWHCISAEYNFTVSAPIIMILLNSEAVVTTAQPTWSSTSKSLKRCRWFQIPKMFLTTWLLMSELFYTHSHSN